MNYLIFFGDDGFKYKKQLLKKEAELTGWFDEIDIHSPETISDFLNEHRDFVEKNKRGYGYWIWKPYVILKLLEKINDGDIIVYLDCGASILNHKKNRFDEYLNILNETDCPIISFAEIFGCPHYPEKYFQKMKILKRFNLDNDQEFLNSGQVESGIFICKKTDFTVNFFQEWLDLSLENNYSLVTDEDNFEQLECFLENRHDQSIFSILCKIHNTHILYLGESYGRGPFFSSRISDEGPRKFAPDLCRRETDHNPEKHLDWGMYLKDNDVKIGVLNQIKSLICEVGRTLHFGDVDYDIKQEFINQVLPKLDTLQTNKGLCKIELSIDQPYSITINKEKLNGQFVCDFIGEDTTSFNFQITASGISFPEIGAQYDKFFRSVYTRSWMGIYFK
jgi:hypothetical protein